MKDKIGALKIRSIGVAVLVAAIALVFAACPNETTGGKKTVAVTGVSLNKTTLALTVGGSETLTATVTPAKASNKNVTWSSGNESVATVSNGVVTAKAVGDATITVTTKDGGKKATCDVTVTADNPTLNKTALQAKIGEAEALKEGVVTGTAAEDVPKGKFWVTEAVMTAFINAISTAEAALESATTQAAVDAAATALQTAMDTFKAARKEGTKNIDPADVEKLIKDAEAAKTGVEISGDGTNVSPAEHWVSQSDIDALDAAIAALNEAEKARDSSGGQEAIDSAYIALDKAIETFNAAKQPGTFVAVTGITGVPTTATAGTALTLTGTVNGDATKKTIVWSVKNAGTTEATISGGNTLNTTGPGTATITATVAGGLLTEDYTQDFTVTVQQAETFTVSFFDVERELTGPTIYLVGGDERPTTKTVTVANPELYSSVIWRVTGTGIIQRGGDSFILNSANTAYNSIGEHFLTVEVITKDGNVPYNKTVIFTVEE